MVTVILLAPLLGAILCGFGYRWFGEKPGMLIATGLLFLACLLSWIVFFSFDGVTEHHPLFRWIVSGTLASDWGVRVDRLTAIMLIVVTTVSALVHLYSFGYMAHDENFHHESYKPRFFAYLSFFTFAMLALVTADNLLQMFFGWEGVGVASYLLIGFYYRKQSAGAAAMKAFIVNRVGDFGFLLGIFTLYVLVDSIDFADIFAAGPTIAQTQITFLWREWNAAEVASFLLFVGAMGKSAQLLLHTWLPDAMEGPTPVSALIHAATMVTRACSSSAACRRSRVGAAHAHLHHLHGRLDRVLRRDRRPRAERHQASSPIRPARSSATCSWRRGSAPIRRRCSTSSPTPSSRRCCSSAPARSSPRCTTSRTCGTTAGCARRSR